MNTAHVYAIQVATIDARAAGATAGNLHAYRLGERTRLAWDTMQTAIMDARSAEATECFRVWLCPVH